MKELRAGAAEFGREGAAAYGLVSIATYGRIGSASYGRTATAGRNRPGRLMAEAQEHGSPGAGKPLPPRPKRPGVEGLCKNVAKGRADPAGAVILGFPPSRDLTVPAAPRFPPRRRRQPDVGPVSARRQRPSRRPRRHPGGDEPDP
jgi:hypothetical protein